MSDCLTILLVDDDEVDRLLLRRTLRDVPFELHVIEAESSASALDQIARASPDCVFLDHRLASEEGIAVLREIRRRELEADHWQSLPVILLTGQGDVALAVEAMKADATDFIPKNEISSNRLACAIRTGIELHRRRAESARAREALRQAHEELERRVQERTADLAAANAELRRCVAELDEFTYVASHDLQEPLRKLVAFSDLLPRDAGDCLPERARMDLAFISEAAQRMHALVQQLLALSRAGKSALRRERVSLEQCADHALEALAVRVQETEARVERQPLPVVSGDATLLTQLYQNLVGNALKFRKPGVMPAIELTCEPVDTGWTLGVRDNGIGVAAQYVDQIFEPFRRLHGRDEYEGSGIGLAICRKAVERHGGRIWVESEPGRGAHFRFTLNHAAEDRECQCATGSAALSC